MSENRDRAGCQFEVDRDLQAVLEFMQSNIPTAKLVGIAERMPQMARLLWGDNQQEPVRPIALRAEPIIAAVEHTRSASSE